MKMKYKYFSVGGNSVFGMIDNKTGIHVCNQEGSYKIELMGEWDVDYWNTHWRKHMASIPKEIFERTYKKVQEKLNQLTDELKKNEVS